MVSQSWATKEICISCGKHRSGKPGQSCSEPRHRLRYTTHRSQRLVAQRRNHEEKWRFVLAHYGGRCACCGFDKDIKVRGQRFLQVDVVNGGHRKKFSSRGGKLYEWLVVNGFPDGFRILDGACNQAMEPRENKCALHKLPLG